MKTLLKLIITLLILIGIVSFIVVFQAGFIILTTLFPYTMSIISILVLFIIFCIIGVAVYHSIN